MGGRAPYHSYGPLARTDQTGVGKPCWITLGGCVRPPERRNCGAPKSVNSPNGLRCRTQSIAPNLMKPRSSSACGSTPSRRQHAPHDRRRPLGRRPVRMAMRRTRRPAGARSTRWPRPVPARDGTGRSVRSQRECRPMLNRIAHALFLVCVLGQTPSAPVQHWRCCWPLRPRWRAT